MTRYIDADEAIDNLNKWVKETGVIVPQTQYHCEMICCIEDCKTADVQPVVHCKDCKYYGKNGTLRFCKNRFWIQIYSPNTKPDDYCSHGEKMDGDEHDNG